MVYRMRRISREKYMKLRKQGAKKLKRTKYGYFKTNVH